MLKPIAPVCHSLCNFLQYILQAAFNAVMHLWNKKPVKVYGGRISESILAILSHIIKGENTIKVHMFD